MRTTWVAVLLPCVSAWRRVLPRGGASVEESALRSFAAAFSERECDAIEELFEVPSRRARVCFLDCAARERDHIRVS